MKSKVEFIAPAQKGEYEYIGFDLESNAGRFVFPCRYIASGQENAADAGQEKEQKEEAKKIVSLIKRVQKEFSLGGSGDESFQFYSMVWLIRDYIDNGYYTETERVVRRGDQGRIDWKHTLRHSGIYFDGNNLLYRDFYVRKNRLDEANLLAQIYKCCLAYSAECIGFLYNVSQTERSVFRMDSSADVGFMCYHVQKELGRTFNSYKQMLLRHLLTILKGRQGKTRAVSLCMHDKEFEYVFEFLVNSVFGTETVQDFYNEYGYKIDDKYFSASKLRPDTIMKNPMESESDEKPVKPDFYVIDAKYYNYGYTENPRDLPQASAIAKQIGYNRYLRQREKKTFYSIFLLPFARREEDKPIKFIGYAANASSFLSCADKRDKMDNEDEKMDKVAVCRVDLKTLVDVYFNVAHEKDGTPIVKADMRRKLAEEVSSCFQNCNKGQTP